MNKNKSHGWQKRLGIILLILCAFWILNFFTGYYYDYGVKTEGNSIFEEQTDSYYKRGSYDFTSPIRMNEGFPKGLKISVQHMTHLLAAPEFFISQIGFEIDEIATQEIILKSVSITHTTIDGDPLSFVHDNEQYLNTNKYLNQKDFPLNLSTHKSPPYLNLVQRYDRAVLPKKIKEHVRIEMLIDGTSHVIEGSVDIELVKRYWKIDAWMSV